MSKGVIKIRKLVKYRQHNDQKKRDERTNKRHKEHTLKTKDRVARSPQKLEVVWKVNSSCSTSDTRLVDLVTNPVISHECSISLKHR